MTFKIPMKGITVVRGGAQFVPPIGIPFDFTASEIKEVRAHDPSALRNPINESEAFLAKSESDLVMRGHAMPDADDTRDANVLRRAPAKAGGKARNQGGSSEEEEINRLSANGKTPIRSAHGEKLGDDPEDSGVPSEDDEL